MDKSLAIRTPGRGDSITLAQSGTRPKGKVVSIGGVVSGRGTDISDNLRLQRWAKRKLINKTLMLRLIDIAKEKGATDRVKSYWHTYRCFDEIITSDGRAYGFYCKNRFCSICCGINKAKKINQYYPIMTHWKRPFFLTLTVKSPMAIDLCKRMDEMEELLRKIISRYKKRQQRGKGFRLVGIHSLECNFKPSARTYNPHFHLILENGDMAWALRKAWIVEGRKLWGRAAIYEKAQDNQEIRSLEKCLVEVLKYSSKIFTSPDEVNRKGRESSGSRVPQLICAAAYDNIIAALKGRRVFERFGFNLPPQSDSGGTTPRMLKHSKEWGYLMEDCDWVEVEGALTLTGYQKSAELEYLLNDRIDIELH